MRSLGQQREQNGRSKEAQELMKGLESDGFLKDDGMARGYLDIHWIPSGHNQTIFLPMTHAFARAILIALLQAPPSFA